MHNSYFHIVMVIMCDECLLSQQGSWWVMVVACVYDYVCVCVCKGGCRQGVYVKGEQGVRRDRKHPEKEKEETGRNTGSVFALIILHLNAAHFQIFLTTVIFAQWR